MKKMVVFDVASDIHLDFWAGWSKSKTNKEENRRKNIQQFIDLIIPEQPSKILVIPGDLGHRNQQNHLFLTMLKTYYDHIILVPGNHDYYMLDSYIRQTYRNNSMNRWQEMVKLAQSIEGVHVLDGTTITLEGVIFGGCGMWYDFSYAQKVWGDSFDWIRTNWQTFSNDNRYIKGLPHDTFLMFETEQKKLDQVVDQSDVIVTHVGPDFKTPSKYAMDKNNSFYYFNGDPYIDRIANKIWLFGHTHERYTYEAYDCTFMNCAIGYPEEQNTDQKERKIITVEI